MAPFPDPLSQEILGSHRDDLRTWARHLLRNAPNISTGVIIAAMVKPSRRLPADLHDLVASARRDRERSNAGYRARALRLFPAVCARCGREFEGKRLRELTVHHKDHDHDNNPADGSNWELLCLYCHENEHDRKSVASAGGADEHSAPRATHHPFAGLGKLLGDPEK